MAVRIWYEDLEDFWNPSRMFEVIPDQVFSYEDRLNRVLRGVMYLSLLLTLLTLNVAAVYPTVITMIVTAVLSHVQNDQDGFATFPGRGKSKRAGDKRATACTRPSKDNPFMNVLISDYTVNPRRAAACALPEVYPDVDKAYRENLFADVDDVYQRETSKRAFYTMPATSIPNDQGSFARWLYGVEGKTCKEGNGQRCPYFIPHAI